MKKGLYFLLIIISVILGVFGSPAFAGSIEDTYGIGIRAISMGGAFTAVADNWSATHYNPAGLAQITGNYLSTEAMYTHPKFHVEKLDGSDLVTYDREGNVRTDPTEGHYRGLDVPQLPVVGIGLDLNNIVNLPAHAQLGIIACFPEYFAIDCAVHNVSPDQPHFIRYGNQINAFSITAGLGVEVLPALLYLGGGMQAQVYGEGRVYQGTATGPNGESLTQMDQSTRFKWDPKIGVLVTPMDGMLRIGASWNDERCITMPLHGSGNLMDILKLKIFSDVAVEYTPEEYSLGLAFNLGPALISLEANKQLWGRYDFTEACKEFYSGSPDFKDTINKRVGFEFKPDENTSLMVGFCYQPTPVPDQSGRETNYLDMDKKIFSFGFSKTVDMKALGKYPTAIGAMFQYQRCDDYTVYKNGEDGPTWENQESYTVKGDVYTAGISITNTW